jgi:NAD(P)-dependent dehydrogenase (short-subunit alcohol dehydrogenase family)
MTGVLEGQGVLLAGIRPLLDIAMADAFVGAGARVMMDDPPASVEGVVADAASTYGRLDVLVTDSGVHAPAMSTRSPTTTSNGRGVRPCSVASVPCVAYPHLRGAAAS